jgi:hypothetical protein
MTDLWAQHVQWVATNPEAAGVVIMFLVVALILK